MEQIAFEITKFLVYSFILVLISISTIFIKSRSIKRNAIIAVDAFYFVTSLISFQLVYCFIYIIIGISAYLLIKIDK